MHNASLDWVQFGVVEIIVAGVTPDREVGEAQGEAVAGLLAMRQTMPLLVPPH